MLNLAELLFNADNVRMLVILAFVAYGYMLLKGKMRDSEGNIKKDMAEQIKAFHEQLKTNDFAHLNATIEALTFTLEKNGFLKREDKKYIDSRLDKG